MPTNAPDGMTDEEYLDKLLARVSRIYDMDERPGDLILRRQRPGDGIIYKVRVLRKDQGHSESRLFVSKSTGEVEAYLRGLETAGFADIELKAGEVDA